MTSQPDILKIEPVYNPNSVKMDISRTLSALYILEWNEKTNVSSKGKQYLLFKDSLNFEKYLMNVSKFIIPKLSNIGLVTIGSQFRLDDEMIYH